MARSEVKAEVAQTMEYLRWCETAAAMGAWHLREPERGEQPKLGGGAKTKTLCGLQAAWDLKAVVALEAIMHESKEYGRTCPGCREAFVAMTKEERDHD